jgi:glycosyltransferase involved in cell wall biosynthesis
LHVTETARGGIATYLNGILPLQIEQYGESCVQVILPSAHHADLAGQPAPVLSCFRSRGSRVYNMLSAGWRAWRQTLLWKPDVVHLHSTLSGLVVRLLLFFNFSGSRPAVIYCPHGWVFDRDSSPLQRRLFMVLERWFSRLCHCVVCISGHEYRAGLAIGIPESRLRLVYNGLDDVAGCCGEPVGWPAGGKKVLFVGRLDRQKGIDVFFDAMAALGD